MANDKYARCVETEAITVNKSFFPLVDCIQLIFFTLIIHVSQPNMIIIVLYDVINYYISIL